MSSSPRKFSNPARLLCLLCVVGLLAGCQTTEQQNQWKAADVNRETNKSASGELSPALEAANIVGEFLSSGAGVHGSF